jgi:hypothetical protein
VSDCFDSTIGRRLTPAEVDALRQITWPTSELAEFDEDDVTELGKHVL